MFIKPLLQRIVILIEKLAGNERLHQGLKFLFGFLTATLSECGSSACAVEKSSGKPVLSCSSGLGPLSSRTLGSRKNADDLVPSANRGSASVDCDATSVDDDEDDGTSDGELGSIDKDERRIATARGPWHLKFVPLHLVAAILWNSTGGVRGSSCQCLKPRKFTGSNSAPTRGAGNFQSFLSLTENGDQLPDSDSDIDEDAPADSDNSARLSLPKEVQDRMPVLLDELEVESRILGVCSSLLPSITGRRDSNMLRDRKVTLVEGKVLHYMSVPEVDWRWEGDRVAIFDVGQLIGQATIAPVTADKANVKPLSKNVVRFEIVHLLFNSLVENYLVVAGYEDCQVLTINHRGEVIDRLAIELALQGAYIRRVEWVPGSQVQLMVVTNRFVKIYDLSQDNISPVHYITLPDDMIVDATLLVASHGRMFLIVLSDSGSLYRLELSMKANVGSRPLKEVIQVEGRNKPAKGSSLYFSSTHKLLCLSYQDGNTLIGRLNADVTSIEEMSAVYENDLDGKLRPAGLHRWKELLGGSGLFVCYSSLKSNGILAISLGEHEVLAQSLRHTGGSTSPLVGVTAYRPLSKDKIHCLVLHEDGSLQIYSHIPAGVDTGVNLMADKVKKLGPGILKNKAYGGVKPEFPLDFFEKAVCITQDVKFSGDAIRNNDSEGLSRLWHLKMGFWRDLTLLDSRY
ncbi:UNVERIFIED_CONTAM: Auxin transport protein BIG [Sesamum radiatum]|uniref:Auxin transport protein BIG n=1 Tax=Sesamum radiatum TaxID=300843 RepID=A0AAW2P6Z6_SESRA